MGACVVQHLSGKELAELDEKLAAEEAAELEVLGRRLSRGKVYAQVDAHSVGSDGGGKGQEATNGSVAVKMADTATSKV